MGHEEHRFVGSSILVVEDEYLIASELEIELRKQGARVLGPASSISDAENILDNGHQVDGAVLDIMLGGEKVYTLADRLLASGTPVIFASGYNRSEVPERFASVPHVTKPYQLTDIVDSLTRLGLRPHLDGG